MSSEAVRITGMPKFDSSMASGWGFKPPPNMQATRKVPPSTSFVKPSYEVSSFALDMPFDQFCLFVRKYETWEIIKSLPIFVVAELGTLKIPPTKPPTSTATSSATGSEDTHKPTLLSTGTNSEEPKVHIPLGLVSTDHTGYASFDLGSLRSADTIAALHREGVVKGTVRAGGDTDGAPPQKVELTHLWVFPFADALLVSDALPKADIGPTFLTLRLEIDAQVLDGKGMDAFVSMPAMQSPSILDYKMSPGSFSLPPTVTIGDEGSCEALMPSNLASHLFRFNQIARAPGKVLTLTTSKSAKHSRSDHITAGRIGYIFDYTTEWYPIGHSLGSLSYTLPLAPGEVVKIAVVDWERSDSATRAEDTQFSESLIHSTLRDRSLTESVTTMLDEWQRGGSIIGGVAGAAAGAGPGAVAGVGALGGAYTTSAGTRNLTASTNQQIADAFHQSTTSMRALRSTVVVQNLQAESTQAQSRVVANYNHGHTLTMLYYEVLRHYRVVTRVASVRLALLVDYGKRTASFDLTNPLWILSHRQEIENLLLDNRLKPKLDAIERIELATAQDHQQAAEPSPGDLEFSSYRITINTSSQNILLTSKAGTDSDPWVDLVVNDATPSRIQTEQIGRNDPGSVDIREGSNIVRSKKTFLGRPPPANAFLDGSKEIFGLTSASSRPSIAWKNLRGFVLGLQERQGKWDSDWRPEHILLEGITNIGDRVTLFDGGINQDMEKNTELPEFSIVRPPAPSTSQTTNIRDEQASSLLKMHLASHSHYYLRNLWLAEDANARAAVFDNVSWNSVPILDIIENRAIEVSGNYVAFPISVEDFQKHSLGKMIHDTGFEDDNPADPSEIYIEQLLSLPTRGVFAEAKLGHCNANEKIDNTRFWDWQTSPIPEKAPDISGVKAGSRYQPPVGTEPTKFPASVANVVSPSALPDPTGLSEALKVLATAGIFRDSSGAKEVASLLGTLSENATSLATSGMKIADRQDLLKTIREAPELSDDRKAALVDTALDHDAKGGRSGTGKGTPTEGGAGSAPAPDPKPAPEPGSPSVGGGGSAGGGHKATDQGESPPDPPKEAPSTPSRGPTKPKKRSPATSTGGIEFQLNFRSFKAATTVQGWASIRVIPKSSSNPYRPGSYNPGRAEVSSSQAGIQPEDFPGQAIKSGSIWLATDRAGAPGNIDIDVEYDNMDVVASQDALGSLVKIPDTATADFRTTGSTYQWSKSADYSAPEIGNLVVLDITPEVKEACSFHPSPLSPNIETIGPLL
jgi:hypothetical protein